MDRPADAGGGPLIDLTHQMDVAYWCRVFDISIEQLREAVHHAGHEVQEVHRYLRRELPGTS